MGVQFMFRMKIYIKLTFLAGVILAAPSFETGSENRVRDTTIHLKQSQLLAVIPEWGPNFRITFDLNVHSMTSTRSDGWANIFYFTATGKDCCSIGDRVPGLWTNSKREAFRNKNENKNKFKEPSENI